MNRWRTDGHWFDEVAVDRFLNGHRVGRELTRAERAHAYRVIKAQPERYPNAHTEDLNFSGRDTART